MKQIEPHLSFEKITDAVVGDKLDAAVLDHLNSCPKCELELMRTTKLVDTMRTDETEDAPAFALAAILRSYDGYTTSTPAPRRSVGERIRAVLRLDSSNLGPAYGFRSAGVASARQLLFSIDSGTIDLRVRSVGHECIISGQILGEMSGGSLTVSGRSVEHTTEIDSNGTFTLPPVPAGVYSLRLVSNQVDIELPELTVE